MAQILNLPRSAPTAVADCWSATRPHPTTRREIDNRSWVSMSMRRNVKSNATFTCLFSGNRKEDQARKALDNALSGKKDEFERWNKEIKKREDAAAGGGDAGGGGWFRWFGGSDDDDFWQEAQQTSLAVLGIILMYLLIAKGEVLLAVVFNPLLFTLRAPRKAFARAKSWVLQKSFRTRRAKLENVPEEEADTHASAKERVASKWGRD